MRHHTLSTLGRLVLAHFVSAAMACANVQDGDQDGYSSAQGDCDDTNPGAHPGAVEVRANRIDEACNGDADEDLDGDGYLIAGEPGEIDCNDENPRIFPGANELEDGIDQNCDGIPDDHTAVFDDDGDSFSETQGDCNDLWAKIYPGAPELIDGFDNDCDGVTDEGTDIDDDDRDLFAEDDGDCDDGNPAVYPGAPETGKTGGTLGDGLDNDCDGLIDEGTWSYDDDGDGFSENGIVGGESDCNDEDPSIYPDAPEVSGDGIDNNCDGALG